MAGKRLAPAVRAAGPGDTEGWLALRAALWPDTPEAEHRQEIADTLPNPRLGALLALVDGVPVGLAELSLRDYAEGCGPGPVGYLEGWYVAPAFRRRGVGAALVRAAEDWARAQGCTEFASDTQLDNVASQEAHARLGFAVVERQVCFRKPL